MHRKAILLFFLLFAHICPSSFYYYYLQVNEAARLADSVLKKESPSSSFPEAPCAMSTWPNLQDTLQFEKAAASIVKSQRPHTISSGYFCWLSHKLYDVSN